MRYNDLEFAYRCGDNTISLFVKEVCTAIYDELHQVLTFPDEAEWQRIIDGFDDNWQMPHCIGALGDKTRFVLLQLQEVPFARVDGSS